MSVASSMLCTEVSTAWIPLLAASEDTTHLISDSRQTVSMNSAIMSSSLEYKCTLLVAAIPTTAVIIAEGFRAS